MAKFKVIVSDPEDGKSKVVEVDGAKAVPLLGRKLGEVIDGSVLGMSGRKLQITGGSDKDGFPMRPNVHGGVRISVIINKSVGFHPHSEGERRRKTLRGNVITDDIVQINMKITEKLSKAEKAEKPKKLKAVAPKAEKEEKQAQSKQEEAVETPKPGDESSKEVAQTT